VYAQYSHPSQRLQIEAAKLQAENQALKSGGTIKQAGHSISLTSSTTAVTTTAIQDQELQREFRGLGKRFAILSELWVERSVLRRPNPQHLQLLGPWHPKRCANDAAWDEGIIAELYFLLPESYHDYIENSATFSEMVRRQVF